MPKSKAKPKAKIPNHPIPVKKLGKYSEKKYEKQRAKTFKLK